MAELSSSSARSKHQRSDPRLQQHRAAQPASLHAAHPGGERPHGLRLPGHAHSKIKTTVNMLCDFFTWYTHKIKWSDRTTSGCGLQYT